MLVLRHELEFFLDDLTIQVDSSAGKEAGEHYRDLVEQVCGPDRHNDRQPSLQNLVSRLHCNLASDEWDEVFDDLRGKHLHMWRDDDSYSIQFSSKDKQIKQALEKIAAGESDCEAHLQPEISATEDGYLFKAKGENAFLYAQLFLHTELIYLIQPQH